jgi:hypothetical protein
MSDEPKRRDPTEADWQPIGVVSLCRGIGNEALFGIANRPPRVKMAVEFPAQIRGFESGQIVSR